MQAPSTRAPASQPTGAQRARAQSTGAQQIAPQPRLTRAAKQEQTRTQLIEAAASVFARRGFQTDTIEEISEETSYSHVAVYTNFANKKNLFLAVFERYMSQRVAEVAR